MPSLKTSTRASTAVFLLIHDTFIHKHTQHTHTHTDHSHTLSHTHTHSLSLSHTHSRSLSHTHPHIHCGGTLLFCYSVGIFVLKAIYCLDCSPNPTSKSVQETHTHTHTHIITLTCGVLYPIVLLCCCSVFPTRAIILYPTSLAE